MKYIKYKKTNFFLLSALIILSDQLTKYFVSFNYHHYANNNYFLFRVDFVRNYGAAFNIFNESRVFLSLVSIIFTFLFIYLILSKNITHNIELLSYSLLLGGTIGNGIDRIIKGYVIDFINLNFINFPVFNIADISINIGFLLILYSLYKIKK